MANYKVKDYFIIIGLMVILLNCITYESKQDAYKKKDHELETEVQFMSLMKMTQYMEAINDVSDDC